MLVPAPLGQWAVLRTGLRRSSGVASALVPQGVETRAGDDVGGPSPLIVMPGSSGSSGCRVSSWLARSEAGM